MEGEWAQEVKAGRSALFMDRAGFGLVAVLFHDRSAGFRCVRSSFTSS
jgi:hypothetical protein